MTNSIGHHLTFFTYCNTSVLAELEVLHSIDGSFFRDFFTTDAKPKYVKGSSDTTIRRNSVSNKIKE